MNYSTDSRDRIEWAFRSATSRGPEKDELEILVNGYERRLAMFNANPDSAKKLLRQGESFINPAFNKVELAALVTLANVILNLDELINK